MNSRSLFLITIAVGSALVGAGVAVKTHLPPQLSLVGQTVARQTIVGQIQQPAPVSTAPSQPVQPIQPTQPPQAAQPLFPPPNSVLASAPQAGDEFQQLRVQLQRAIRDRNPVLLRSLMQAGSLREAFKGLATTEQVNFDNLDASTWRILEKAIDYRCRQQATENNAICFK
jgi:hypothetical protein